MTRFPRLAEFVMPSYYEFHPEKLITELGLYEAVLIDTIDILDFPEIGDDPPHLEVSKDVAALHRFLNMSDRIMLPCPDCKQSQPFDFRAFINPQKVHPARIGKGNSPSSKIIVDNTHNVIGSAGKYNVFDLPTVPNYQIAQDYLCNYDPTQFRDNDYDDYKYHCAIACVDGISNHLGEVRRDFYCTLDPIHHGFVDFIIYEAVDRYVKPVILSQYDKRKEADPSSEMTKVEKKASEDYERLKTCLILEKVGQYPSMADLQMFDIEKYQKVLSTESFHDFKTALGLYASGVGCGSFVYLRRIFERLVIEAEKIASTKDGWNAEEYEKKRVNEKIDYLEGFGQKLIPDELANVKTNIYGVLSRGVHASSDQECKELFPAMKYVIEELLDHKIAQKERAEKLKQINSVIGSISK